MPVVKLTIPTFRNEDGLQRATESSLLLVQSVDSPEDLGKVLSGYAKYRLAVRSGGLESVCVHIPLVNTTHHLLASTKKKIDSVLSSELASAPVSEVGSSSPEG